MRAADAGDVDALRSSLASHGHIDVDEAQDIARRFIERQVMTAQGPAGRRTLDALDGCAAAFDDSLHRRSEHDDELGAQAAHLRMDAGLVPPMTYAHYLTSPEPHWRAVAARSLVVPRANPPRLSDRQPNDLVKAGVWRRRLMLDPSTQVRVAALKASYDAADSADAQEVLEAARLDPDSEVRLVAIQAAGKIGTRDVVIGLQDLWRQGDEEMRLAIVGAWVAASRRQNDLGAQVGCAPSVQHPGCTAWHKLQRVSDLGVGMPSLVASLELIHDVTPQRALTPEGNAAAVIERMIDGASTRVRVEAIASVPLSWPHLRRAVIAASKGDDRVSAVAALARLAELGGESRAEAIDQLRKHAETSGLVAERARVALARLGDGQVVPLLVADADAASAEQRAKAAQQYARLGKVSAALRLLADHDARVRSRAACAILAMRGD